MAETRKRRIVRRAMMALVGVVLLVVGGCGNLLEDLAFVLPPNYSGPFVVVEDPNAPEIPYQNGAYTINVPQSGVVRVKSAALFERETNQTARRGARDIPISIGHSGNVVALHWGTYSGGAYDVFFVGTQREFDNAHLSRVHAVGDRLVWPTTEESE